MPPPRNSSSSYLPILAGSCITQQPLWHSAAPPQGDGGQTPSTVVSRLWFIGPIRHFLEGTSCPRGFSAGGRLLSFGLFQQTTSGSVGECFARRFRRRRAWPDHSGWWRKTMETIEG